MLQAIYSLIGESVAAIADGLWQVVQWLGDAIAYVVDGLVDIVARVWNEFWAVVASAVGWAMDLVPDEWVSVFDWGSGVPGGSSWESYFGSAMAWWPDLSYVFPILPMLLLITTTFSLIGAIRLARWALGAIPTLNL